MVLFIVSSFFLLMLSNLSSHNSSFNTYAYKIQKKRFSLHKVFHVLLHFAAMGFIFDTDQHAKKKHLINIKVKRNWKEMLVGSVRLVSKLYFLYEMLPRCCCKSLLLLLLLLLSLLLSTQTLPLLDVVALILRTACRRTAAAPAPAVRLQEPFICKIFYWKGASLQLVKMLFSALEMFFKPHLWLFVINYQFYQLLFSQQCKLVVESCNTSPCRGVICNPII